MPLDVRQSSWKMKIRTRTLFSYCKEICFGRDPFLSTEATPSFAKSAPIPSTSVQLGVAICGNANNASVRIMVLSFDPVSPRGCPLAQLRTRRISHETVATLQLLINTHL